MSIVVRGEKSLHDNEFICHFDVRRKR